MDDHETHARGNLMDQLTIGLNNSKCGICFITKRYSESKNCVLELTYMHENDIPFIIVMVEDIKPKDLGAVGLLITPKTRLNFYKQDHDFDNIWSNERFLRLTETIQYFIDKYEKEKNFAKINNSRSTINSFTSFETVPEEISKNHALNKQVSNTTSSGSEIASHFLRGNELTIRDLENECYKIVHSSNLRDMLSKDRFSIDNIMFDPAQKLIKDFRRWYKSHNDPKFSKPLIELLLNNSKMENWPSEFTTKELLLKNKEAFLNIKWCK